MKTFLHANLQCELSLQIRKYVNILTIVYNKED